MTKKIKILFTIPNFDTAGSGRVVYDLVKGLDKTRFAPEICCFHHGGAFFEAVKTLEVPIHIFNFTTNYRPWLTFPFRVYKIARFFKQHQFDLIHSWHWSSDISEPLAAKWAGIPFVYTKKAMGWGNRAWVWRSKLSKKIIVINSDMGQQFFGKMTDKVANIPIGIDTEVFKPLKKVEVTPSLKFTKADFVVVTVANLVPVKGIEVLLEAVRQMKDPSIKVLMIGDDKNTYGQELKRAYASDQIHFLGKQLDVRPYLAVADVFVIPTKDEGRKEGLPIAPLEAMALGCMVIGSNISGIKDMLKDHQDLLFYPGDIEDLIRKLHLVRHLNADETIKLKDAMRQTVLQRFRLEEVLKKHEHLYTKLIG